MQTKINKIRIFIVVFVMMVGVLIFGPIIYGYFYVDPPFIFKNKTNSSVVFSLVEGGVRSFLIKSNQQIKLRANSEDIYYLQVSLIDHDRECDQQCMLNYLRCSVVREDKCFSKKITSSKYGKVISFVKKGDKYSFEEE